jgi:hypothetical protein
MYYCREVSIMRSRTWTDRNERTVGLKFTYPSTLSQTVKTQLICDLGSVHGILVSRVSVVSRHTWEGIPLFWTYRQILLVGKHQQDGIPQLVLVQHALELLSGLDDTVAIVGVDDEDNALGVLEVMPPERSDLVLATDVPYGKLDVLVLDRLDVEAYPAREQRP